MINSNLYVNTTVTLYATVSYLDSSDSTDYELTVKAHYKQLNAPLASSYIYTNYSSVNENYFNTMDIINCAFTIANASATLTGTNFFNNVTNYIIDSAHAKGCYVILSIAPESEWTTFANPDNNLVETLANNIVNAINTYHFDGVDIDWEYPKSGQYTWFTNLVQIVNQKVKANNPHHLVTAAIGGGMWQPAYYDLNNSIEYLDYINVMCYDMIQSGGSYQNGLYRTTTFDNNEFSVGRTYTTSCSIEETVNIFKNTYNISSNKLIIGVPFYAVRQSRTYTDGVWSSWAKAGTNNYATIKALMSNPDYAYHFDNNSKVPYIVKNDGTEFYSFDDPTSLGYKCQYIIDNNLGGIMNWQNGSDTTGDLVNAIKVGLNK